ncbi:MAG: hypothetical protein PHX10_02540 [Gallionellaceae bacterium]|nr:hypothetical protein [Gallionellaceae bacterium]
MKRKALIMSMAVATGFPGWAMAKGAKAQEGGQASAAGVQAQGLLRADQDLVPVTMYPDESSVEVRNKAKELLAQIKSTLMAANIGAIAEAGTHRTSQWKMEMMESNTMAGVDDNGDPRVQQTRPVGMAFRLKF